VGIHCWAAGGSLRRLEKVTPAVSDGSVGPPCFFCWCCRPRLVVDLVYPVGKRPEENGGKHRGNSGGRGAGRGFAVSTAGQPSGPLLRLLSSCPGTLVSTLPSVNFSLRAH